jgi:hypothetical protein
VVGDREYPGPELPLIPLEPGRVASHLEEDLAEHIVGVGSVVRP